MDDHLWSIFFLIRDIAVKRELFACLMIHDSVLSVFCLSLIVLV